MKKIIKTYGNAKIIRLSPDDMEIYDIKVGDVVELHIRKVNGEEIDQSTQEDY